MRLLVSFDRNEQTCGSFGNLSDKALQPRVSSGESARRFDQLLHVLIEALDSFLAVLCILASSSTLCVRASSL